MADPKRLLDPASRAPERVRQMLAAGRNVETMQRRTWHRGLDRATSLGIAAGVVSLSALSTKALAVAIAASAALVTVGSIALRADPEPASAAAPEHATPAFVPRVTPAQTTPTASPAPIAAPASAAEPTVASQSVKPTASPEPTPVPASERLLAPPRRPERDTTDIFGHVPASPEPRAEDPLTAEARVLGQAHTELARDPARALALLEEHDRIFPRLQLRAERDLIALEALIRLGRFEQARTRADALQAATPTSLYAERIRRLMERIP